MPHIVIIGGGFAGLDAARALARDDVQVTLVDRHNHHVFQPLLYQVATAGLSPGDIASPIRWILRRQKNLRVVLGEVQRIEPVHRRLLLDGGETMSYDALIVAAGLTPSYFGHPEWQTRAPALKTLDDALEIRRRVLTAFEQAEREPDARRIRQLLTFVIIGGGPTGVELAGALAEIARKGMRTEFDHVDPASARIVLIEAGPTIMSTFPASLRDAARRSLVKLGIEVHEAQRVTAIDADGVQIGQDRVDAATVLWAAGVKASSIGSCFEGQLERDGRVRVHLDLSVPGFPEVLIAGDMVSLDQHAGQRLPGVAQAAKQLGAHAARNAVRRLRGEPLTPFHYFNPGSLATIGRNSAIADFGFLRLSGYLAWLVWVFLHIAFLIGFRNRLSVMLQWATSYITYQRSVRLITGDAKAAPAPPITDVPAPPPDPAAPA